MFTYAVIFLIISLIAGALGMANVSRLAKRISLGLFALFFAVFLAAVGLIYLVSEPSRPASAPPAPERSLASMLA